MPTVYARIYIAAVNAKYKTVNIDAVIIKMKKNACTGKVEKLVDWNTPSPNKILIII